MGELTRLHRLEARVGSGCGALQSGSLAWALMALLAPASVLAATQETCETALQSAMTSFQEGQFDAARDAVNRCVSQSARRAERIQAYALLAKIQLALDDLPGAEAALRKLLDADPEYQPELFDTPRFTRLVAVAKRRKQTPVVSSVSKSVESLLEAPASVVVITGAEIERRGYLDVEAVLHDLPGFDFSKRAGAGYSNIYQRGYRSIETNRTLVLLDGVEENDLSSSAVWVSRQFALTNIDRIEVIYGPASTMYGANAFVGVVNIITKDPKTIVGEGRKLGGDVRVTGGSWHTGSVDATVAGQTTSGDLAWSLTARRYKGNDFENLKDYPEWDFSPAFYDTVNYAALKGLNITDAKAAQTLIDKYSADGVSRYFDIERGAGGQVTGLKLNPAGVTAARALDKTVFGTTVFGKSVGFGLPVDDWQIYAKLQASNFLFGVQYWRNQEPADVPLVDAYGASGRNGFQWTPEHTTIYAKYSRRVMDDKLSLTSLTQYKRHDLDGTDSANVFLSSYYFGNLSASDLLADKPSAYSFQYNARSNDQLRSELNAYYEHSRRLNAVGGVELRLSSVGAKQPTSAAPDASEAGTISNPIAGDNHVSSRDLGAYLQASVRPSQPLKLVVGGRLDNNKIRETGGFGTVFNPRLAAVYSWKGFVFKGLYAKAFQDASNWQKYEVLPGLRELNNPGLAPERVSNYELSASWKPSSQFDASLSGYWAKYEGTVAEVTGVPCPAPLTCKTTSQYQNFGSTDIKGLMGEAHWAPSFVNVWANYTYAHPYDSMSGLRVGDIATHRVNLLASRTVLKKLDLDLRMNWVLGRITGKGTTVSNNPFTKIDNYAVLNGAATYRGLLRGVDVQLVVDNVLGSLYYDPSMRNPSGFPIAARIPQPPRTLYLRLRASR